MDPGDGPERVALTVPITAVGSSSRRQTRLAVAIWSIALAGIAWLGLVSHDGETAIPGPPIAAVPAPEQATAAPSPAQAQARNPAPPIVVRRTLGEDGVMGGLAFGDNPPRLSQADMERDGYRYYQALMAHDPIVGGQAPP